MAQPCRQGLRVTSSYPVLFTSGLFERDNPLLAEVLRGDDGPAGVVAVVDDGVARRHPRLLGRLGAYARRHGDAMALPAPPLVVPGGRAARSDAALPARVRGVIDDDAADRRPAYVLAIGGTAVLDVAGHAAATARRGGVQLVRVPTTVLAQNDSGFETNHGADALDGGGVSPGAFFAPPYAVLNDFSFLATLDDRDWRAGVAEAVRVAVMRDPAFFATIVKRVRALVARDLEAMTGLIRRSAELHREHAAAPRRDRSEPGAARPLDFGHWAALRLVHLTDHRLRPGEALAVGMALDLTYSRLIGLLRRDDWERVLDLLEALGLVLYAPELADHLDQPGHPRCVLRGLRGLREPLPAGGRPTITLLERIGRAVEVDAVDEAVYARAVGVLRGRAEREARYARQRTAV